MRYQSWLEVRSSSKQSLPQNEYISWFDFTFGYSSSRSTATYFGQLEENLPRFQSLQDAAGPGTFIYCQSNRRRNFPELDSVKVRQPSLYLADSATKGQAQSIQITKYAR